MKLDKQKLVELLEEADKKYFIKHEGTEYRAHLDFSASYIVEHYSDAEPSVKGAATKATPEERRKSGR